MDGDKSDGLQLGDGNLGSIPDDGSRQRRSVLSRHWKAFGNIIGVAGLLLFLVSTHKAHIARDVSEVGFLFDHQKFKSIYMCCSYRHTLTNLVTLILVTV